MQSRNVPISSSAKSFSVRAATGGEPDSRIVEKDALPRVNMLPPPRSSEVRGVACPDIVRACTFATFELARDVLCGVVIGPGKLDAPTLEAAGLAAPKETVFLPSCDVAATGLSIFFESNSISFGMPPVPSCATNTLTFCST